MRESKEASDIVREKDFPCLLPCLSFNAAAAGCSVYRKPLPAPPPPETAPPVVRRKNPGLSPGTEKIVVSGGDGLTVKSWLSIDYGGGKVITRQLGVYRYQPLPKIIEYN